VRNTGRDDPELTAGLKSNDRKEDQIKSEQRWKLYCNLAPRSNQLLEEAAKESQGPFGRSIADTSLQVCASIPKDIIPITTILNVKIPKGQNPQSLNPKE
jgi:hypothetical protein